MTLLSLLKERLDISYNVNLRIVIHVEKSLR